MEKPVVGETINVAGVDLTQHVRDVYAAITQYPSLRNINFGPGCFGGDLKPLDSIPGVHIFPKLMYLRKQKTNYVNEALADAVVKYLQRHAENPGRDLFTQRIANVPRGVTVVGDKLIYGFVGVGWTEQSMKLMVIAVAVAAIPKAMSAQRAAALEMAVRLFPLGSVYRNYLRDIVGYVTRS